MILENRGSWERPLGSDEDQKQILEDVGEEILAALSAVAQAAQRALSEAPEGISRMALLRPSNMIVGDAKPERFIGAMNSENRVNLSRLVIEPFVARVEVAWEHEGGQSLKTYYFPRRSAAGLLIATNVAPHEEVGGPACRRRDRCICNRFAHTRRCPEISMHFAPVADAQCTDRRLNNFQPRSSGAGFPRQIHF